MGVAGLVGLKKRIQSIQSTRKLTKAMALVATSKLKKVRTVLTVNNDYFYAYKDIMAQILPSVSDESKYIVSNKSDKKLLIVVGSDTGMCGSYNNTIVTSIEEKVGKDKENYELLVLGEKCKSICKRHKFTVVEYSKVIGDVPEIDSAKAVFNYALEKYISGEYGEVSIVYTWFKNTIVRQVKDRKLLPLKVEDFEINDSELTEFDMEGDKEALTELIIPNYCECLLLNTMLNSKASEHSVRSETMNSATRNADDLCDSLRIKYNRIRQGAITQEITEIVGGVEAQN